jgi:hypothetical protein
MAEACYLWSIAEVVDEVGVVVDVFAAESLVHPFLLPPLALALLLPPLLPPFSHLSLCLLPSLLASPSAFFSLVDAATAVSDSAAVNLEFVVAFAALHLASPVHDPLLIPPCSTLSLVPRAYPEMLIQTPTSPSPLEIYANFSLALGLPVLCSRLRS